MQRPKDLPEFTAPPVGEMLLGVQFGTLAGFQSIHLGKLHGIFSAQYPSAVEVAPLTPSFEHFGSPQGTEISMGFRMGPALPRLWFISANGERLIQFQPDRLILNWRKQTEDSQYPRYESLENAFEDAFQELISFLNSQKIPPPKINQCEVTYVNYITHLNGKTVSGDAASVLKCWRGGCVLELGPDVENTEARIRQVIRDSDGTPLARMMVEASPQYAIESGQTRAALTLTVRGSPKTPELEGAIAFFRMARFQIVTSFARLTPDELHRDWGRLK